MRVRPGARAMQFLGALGPQSSRMILTYCSILSIPSLVQKRLVCRAFRLSLDRERLCLRLGAQAQSAARVRPYIVSYRGFTGASLPGYQVESCSGEVRFAVCFRADRRPIHDKIADEVKALWDGAARIGASWSCRAWPTEATVSRPSDAVVVPSAATLPALDPTSWLWYAQLAGQSRHVRGDHEGTALGIDFRIGLSVLPLADRQHTGLHGLE